MEQSIKEKKSNFQFKYLKVCGLLQTFLLEKFQIIS